MDAIQTDLVESEEARVMEWREQELLRAGYDPHAASQLAAHHDVDLRRASWLLEHGCPVDLALQILL